MSNPTNIEDQSFADAELLDTIRRTVRLTRAGSEIPNVPLRDWLISWLDTQREGKPLSQILRLPRNDGLLEIIQSDGAYAPMPLGFRATLRATESVEILVKEEHYVVSGHRDGFYVSGGIRRIRKTQKKLSAGEEITLPIRYALLALAKHSATAWPAETRDTSGAIPQKDVIEEIGWSTIETIDGAPLESTPPKRPRGRPRKDAE